MKVAVYLTKQETLEQLRAASALTDGTIELKTLPSTLVRTKADEYWTDSAEIFDRYRSIDKAKFVYIGDAGEEAAGGVRHVPSITAQMLEAVSAGITHEDNRSSAACLQVSTSDKEFFEEIFAGLQAKVMDTQETLGSENLDLLDNVDPAIVSQALVINYAPIERLLEQQELEHIMHADDTAKAGYEEYHANIAQESQNVPGMEEQPLSKSDTPVRDEDRDSIGENALCVKSGSEQIILDPQTDYPKKNSSNNVQSGALINTQLNVESSGYPDIEAIIPAEIACSDIAAVEDNFAAGSDLGLSISADSEMMLNAINKEFEMAEEALELPLEPNHPLPDETVIEIAHDDEEFSFGGTGDIIAPQLELTVREETLFDGEKDSIILQGEAFAPGNRKPVFANQEKSINLPVVSRPGNPIARTSAGDVKQPQAVVRANTMLEDVRNRNKAEIAAVHNRFVPKLKEGVSANIPKQQAPQRKVVNRRKRSGGKVYVFGSTGRKAGATVMAYNFACECSRKVGAQVVLLDMDFITSELSKRIYSDCGFDFKDSCGIENVLQVTSNEYLSNLDIFTAGVVNHYGDSFSFIRSNPTYPYQVKKLLCQANFTTMIESLKMIFDYVVVDIGNFKEIQKYKADLLGAGYQAVAIFNCSTKRTVVESQQVSAQVPSSCELVLSNYNIAVNPIEIAKLTHRKISGTINTCRAMSVSQQLPLMSLVEQSNISSDWSAIVDSIRNM